VVVRARWILLGGAAVAAIACSLSLEGYTSDDTTDGGSDGGGDGPGSGDDGPNGDDGGHASIPPVQITTTGQVGKATGLPMQSHLVFAEHAGRWVLFFVDTSTPTELRTRISTDFKTWKDADSLDLPAPHGNEGRNFAIAYAPLGPADIFEVAISAKFGSANRRHHVSRAALAGDTIGFGAITQQCMTPSGDSTLDPDGPAIAIANDGYVHDFTGWWTNLPDGGGGTGNEWVFRSSIADVGGVFTPTWSGTSIEGVPNICNARGALPIGGADVLSFWEKGDSEPNPQNVRFARMSGGSWSSPSDIFKPPGKMDPGDFAALVVSPTEAHAVRIRLDGNLDHARYDGNKWSGGGSIPPEKVTVGGGIALVLGTGGPMLLALADGGGDVRGTTWNGTAWSTWSTIVPKGTPRTALVGWSSSKSAVAWTETSGSGFAIGAFQLR
jgi:hypothetical protein